MSRDPWRLVRDGADAVLCVDFTQARVREQAGFADLALPDNFGMWGTDEGAWETDTIPPAPVERVAGVLGYCGGGALACGLAARLGTRPPVVLFDPVAVVARTLFKQVNKSLAGLGADPVDESGFATADLAALAGALADHYAAVAGPVCAQRRIPESIAGQLCDRVSGYLHYLVRSSRATFDYDGPVLVVLSEGQKLPDALNDRPFVRMPVTTAEVLAHPAAAQAAANALLAAPDTE